MKNPLIIVMVIAISQLTYAQSSMKDYGILKSESDKLLLFSSDLMALSFRLGERTPDGLKLKTAGVIVARYVFDISSILSLYTIYSKVSDQADRKLIEDQISASLLLLGVRIGSEKRAVLGIQPLIDPLDFDSYQARKEVATVLDQLEYLSNRLNSMGNRVPE